MKKHLLLLGYLSTLSVLALAQTITITLQPGPTDGIDAEVFSCVPCGYDVRNFGNKKDLDAIAWTNNGNETLVRSLLQFDLSSIPPGSVIVDARLSLYNYAASQEGTHFTTIFHPNESKLQRISSPWDEHTVTWNTQPTATKHNQVPLPETTSPNQDFIDIRCKKLVQDMIDKPATSFGFRLKLRVEHTFKKLIFASSDNPDASIRPKLVVTYKRPGPKMISPEVSDLRTEMSDESNPTFEIFPNPVKDVLTVSYETTENTSASLKIFGIAGNEIYSQSMELTAGENDFHLKTNVWTKGIYFVRITTSKGVLTQKLIVE